jgi:hypothetical protein
MIETVIEIEAVTGKAIEARIEAIETGVIGIETIKDEEIAAEDMVGTEGKEVVVMAETDVTTAATIANNLSQESDRGLQPV